MRLERVSGPTDEIISVAFAKLYCRINHDVEDILIENWIKAAREEAEGFTNKSFLTQVWDYNLDRYPDTPICLPRFPVQSVDSIKTYDTDDTETSLDLTDFIIDLDGQPARIELAYSKTWPSTLLREINGLKIRFTAGYTSEEDIESTVKDAISLYVSMRHENRSGEIDFPKAFYKLLAPQRMFV